MTAAGSPHQCVLEPGESIDFVMVAGNGGNGGVGGPGGGGCAGEFNGNGVAGGSGGGGGLGGAGGAGAAVSGRYTNNTGSTVTLEVEVGANGANGAPGAPGSTVGCFAGADHDGQNGNPGTNGVVGAPGGSATISALNQNGPASLIAAASGGAGGTGGIGGTGGQGGRANGTPGVIGALGASGTAGATGVTDPNPLPAGMTAIANDGNPRVTFTAVSPVVVLPLLPTEPAMTEPTAAPTTTTTAPTTTTTAPAPTTTVPATSTTVPAPVPDGGALPDLAPGQRQAFENGLPTEVEVFVENDIQLVMQGDGFALRLRAECTDGCTIDTTAAGREVLTLQQQGGASVDGEGFQPGSLVHVWLFSEPQRLGTLMVNDDGTFGGRLSLDGTEVGEHTLQVNGISADGVARTANLGVVVNPASTPVVTGEVLPATGRVTSSLVILSLLLLGVGAVAVGRRTRVLR